MVKCVRFTNIELPVQQASNSGQKIYCVKLKLQFASKSAAIKAMKEAGYPSFIQRTLNKAINERSLAGGFHWELVKE
jgi:hypothetical protein